MIRPGDSLIVWKLDRLGRNLRDLLAIVDYLEEKGANLEILDQKLDTQSASGKAFLSMLGVFAEFENNLRRERQKEGIEKAKREGRYTGRPETFDREEIKSLIDDDMRPCDIMKKTGISKASFYRIKKELVVS
jgi:DNA invertase Pin-like site-specific DNA recombinase